MSLLEIDTIASQRNLYFYKTFKAQFAKYTKIYDFDLLRS
jgi:hypothetical protein